LLIWISGPTGAGKTTLTRCLRDGGYAAVGEDLLGGRLEQFASDPKANCEPLQRHLMTARFESWKKIRSAPGIVFDRSIDEDVNVFCKMHVHAGWLTENEFRNLAAFGQALQEQMPNPDLIIFVTASLAVLLERVQHSGGPPQILHSLKDQLVLYSDWLETRKEEKMLVDTSKVSEPAMTGFFRGIRTC